MVSPGSAPLPSLSTTAPADLITAIAGDDMIEFVVGVLLPVVLPEISDTGDPNGGEADAVAELVTEPASILACVRM